MRGIGWSGFSVFAALVSAFAAPAQPATSSPTITPPVETLTNPNTQAPVQQRQTGVFDVKKVAAATHTAVALITVLDKSGNLLKLGTGFFVSADGKLVTNAHVIEGADTVIAKLENGAMYSIRGVLKAALDKDLVLLKADAKDVPSLAISREGSLPDVGSRVAVIGSPLGLEGSVSEGIISGHRGAMTGDQWLQMTAAVSPGSSGSPVVDETGRVVGVATFVIANAQALNFARPVSYISELLEQAKSTTEIAPYWTITANPKNVVLNDPDFIAAENALQKNDPATALKLLNGIAKKYSDNDAFLFKLGTVYERLNLLDDAVQTYQHGLKLEPTSGVGWTNLGNTLAKLRRFGEAKDAAAQAVKQSPDYGPAWALLGNMYAQESRFAEAADALQKASQLMPADAELWRLAEKYSKMNESKKLQEVTSASPIPQASQVVPTTEGSDSSAAYRDLVMGTLGAFQRRDMNAIVARYADKVVYRDYGVVDQTFIRKDLERYFTRWPVTETQLKGLVRVFDTKKPDEKRVLFSYDFHATSPDRGASSAGSTSNEWWVWETQGTLKVFGDKQKITRTHKDGADEVSDTAGEPARSGSPPIDTDRNNRRIYTVVAPPSKGLRVRVEPNAKSAIVARVHQGDRVYVDNGRVRNNRPPSPVVWQKVTTMNGDTGWINAEYIAPQR